MKTLYSLLVLALTLAAPKLRANTYVKMDSSVGTMIFELYDLEKPLTVQLFLSCLGQADLFSPNYIGAYAHRATNNYIAQAGNYGVQDWSAYGFGLRNVSLPITPDGAVRNELNYGQLIPNTYGTISMVPWTPSPGSTNTFVTSGFVFNLNDNPNLDDPSFGGGFPVFGHLVSGWDAFALLNPTNGNPALRVTNFSSNLPELPVRASAGPTLTYDDFIYLNMSQTAVPEPTTLTFLVGAGVVGILWRRHARTR